MRSKIFIFLFLLPCVAFTLREERDQSDQYEFVPTGILLDSMNNEVLLVTEEGKPVHYVCHIFTPVCNTGECMPVYINIYWDLMGKYSHFDFDNGAILTKLDHVPFTPSDYILLDKILREPDPRFQSLPTHAEIQSHGASDRGDNQQASPSAPIFKQVFQTKYEMVDGISGATRPEQVAKFVPGALYTCYTLWGLANDHEEEIYNYTIAKLIHPHRDYLLERADLKCQDFVLNELAKEKTGDNARIDAMMEIFNNSDPAVSLVILERIYYYHLEIEIVANSFEQKFFAPSSPLDTANAVKKRILSIWGSGAPNKQTLLRLAGSLDDSNNLFTASLSVLRSHFHWPEGTIKVLMKRVEKQHDPNSQRAIFELVESNKKNITNEDWERVKQTKKRMRFQ